MRVSKYLRNIIQDTAKESFGQCELILFGSRVDEQKKGGDFDIALKGDMTKKAFDEGKVKFFKKLILKDLDLPIELVFYNQVNKELQKEIDSKGVKL